MRSKKLSDLSDRPTACRAVRLAQWNTAGSTQKIPFDATSYDLGGNFSASQARYICPTDGLYESKVSVMSAATNPQFQIMLYKNGVYTSGGIIIGAVSGGIGVHHSDILACKAGDYIEGWIWIGIAAITIPANSGGQSVWMTVVRIGERNL